jgi:hypothetical protein
MEYSIWHRGKTSHTWVLVAMPGTQEEALAAYDRLHDGYRSGQLRLADPGGIVVKTESCTRRMAAVV